MPTSSTAISMKRRVAAAASLVATGGGLAAIAVHDLHWVEWSLLAFGGAVAAAGIGLARQSMVAQVLSRATAWIVLVPSMLVTLATLAISHSPELGAAALAVGSGGALLLARPMLHTPKAKSDFDPKAYRRWLFAASTFSAFNGIVGGIVALDAIRWSSASAAAVGASALSLSMIASAVGVVRMRAWGLLLGGVTAAASLITALTLLARSDVLGLVFAFAAIPGLMMGLPVLLAQRARSRAAATAGARVRVAAGLDDAGATSPALYRIATDDAASRDVATDGELSAESSAREATAARAARVA